MHEEAVRELAPDIEVEVHRVRRLQLVIEAIGDGESIRLDLRESAFGRRRERASGQIEKALEARHVARRVRAWRNLELAGEAERGARVVAHDSLTEYVVEDPEPGADGGVTGAAE